jgi:octaprenyl-diphosphate synthase
MEMFVSERKMGKIPGAAALAPHLGSDWKEIIQPIGPFLSQVEVRLKEQIDAFDPEIARYAQYALTNQGKQLRPSLTALSGSAVGALNDESITLAVIIEMVHLATLVHDDIMDEAVVRRSKPTLAAHWGNEIAVLLGDCLFAHAVQLAATFPTPDVCRAVAFATNRVCSGEILQTHARRNFELRRADYFKMLEMKTGELFALSCDLGSWLAGATPEQRAGLRSYGLILGTAYQIYDDCLDLFGNEELAGKSLGTDLASGKITLPLLIVLEQGDRTERRAVQEMIGKWDAALFPNIFELLEKFDALKVSQGVIEDYLGRARRELEVLPPSRSLDCLLALAEFLAQQTRALGVSL